MSNLRMPSKGSSAKMLADLQAEHAEAEVTTEESAVEKQPEAVATKAASSRKQATAANPSPPPPAVTREQRVAFALDRAAEDETTVITVRIPACLNHYIDEYVARRRSLEPKSKYRKQDAVAEAFAAFYADHPLPTVKSDQVTL